MMYFLAAVTLTLSHVHKQYGGRTVLDDVSLALEPGRIRALVGENGAGKSTLVQIACGMVPPDGGSITFDARPVTGWSAREATRAGLGVVHQHFTLVETFTVADNVVLGREPRRGPFGLFVDRERARERVRALGEKYGLVIDPDRRVESLSVGERQRVELLRVLDAGARCILFDEPTAVLSPSEVRGLLEIMRSLAKSGAALLFISHKLDEVFAIADDITVLRRGKIVLDARTDAVSKEHVTSAVVGGAVPELRRARTPSEATVALAVTALECNGVRSVSLSVRKGEVLGIAGVEGNGQRPLLEAIAGVLPIHSGTVVIDGHDCTRASALERRRAGLGFVPEDREHSGLCGPLSIAENLSLGEPAMASGDGVLSATKLRAHATRVIERYDIRPTDPDTKVQSLSGGNAQKVLVARELERPLKVLLLAQPTRGVDIGAATAIRQRVLDARDQGLAVLLVASELDELRALSDRIAVMFRGQIVAEMPAHQASDERLGPWMIGAGS
jgi:simple sugar transport system ATP-binding protein